MQNEKKAAVYKFTENAQEPSNVKEWLHNHMC